tara:strand:- start:224 stop:535 length:312 start_codon:yes stop_codon:yes gene_type:complete
MEIYFQNTQEVIPRLQFKKITIPPNTVLPPHTNPVINSAVIIKGILEITDKDWTKQIFKKDEAFNEVVNIIHSAKVIGETPVEVIVFYAGTKKLPLTIFTKNN